MPRTRLTCAADVPERRELACKVKPLGRCTSERSAPIGFLSLHQSFNMSLTIAYKYQCGVSKVVCGDYHGRGGLGTPTVFCPCASASTRPIQEEEIACICLTWGGLCTSVCHPRAAGGRSNGNRQTKDWRRRGDSPAVPPRVSPCREEAEVGVSKHHASQDHGPKKKKKQLKPSGIRAGHCTQTRSVLCGKSASQFPLGSRRLTACAMAWRPIRRANRLVTSPEALDV